MIVKYAVICSICGERGPEFGPLVSCALCGQDVNQCCAHTWREDEGRTYAICRECA